MENWHMDDILIRFAVVCMESITINALQNIMRSFRNSCEENTLALILRHQIFIVRIFR